MSIAVQADIETLLQVEFDSDPEDKAVAAIVAAQALVEAVVGVPFDQTEDVVYLTGRGQTNLVLPRWPVSAVAIVHDGQFMGSGYHWDASGSIQLVGGVPWWSEPKGVVVTYTAGWADADAAPGALRQLVARVAARVWQSGVAFAENKGVAGIVQETIGGYSVTYGDFARDGAVGATLSEDDKEMARRFRRDRHGGIPT